MPPFTCYRLHETLHGRPPADLDDYVDIDEHDPDVYGPVTQGDFEAKLYVNLGPPHPPIWAGFVLSGFNDASNLPRTSSVGAAIIIKLSSVPKDTSSPLPLATLAASF